MALFDMIKPLSTVLSSAVSNSQQHQEKNYWDCWELNPGRLGEKQGYYLCAMQPPMPNDISNCGIRNNGMVTRIGSLIDSATLLITLIIFLSFSSYRTADSPKKACVQFYSRDQKVWTCEAKLLPLGCTVPATCYLETMLNYFSMKS